MFHVIYFNIFLDLHEVLASEELNIRSEDLFRCLWLGTDALPLLSVSDAIFVKILSLCLGPESA